MWMLNNLLKLHCTISYCLRICRMCYELCYRLTNWPRTRQGRNRLSMRTRFRSSSENIWWIGVSRFMTIARFKPLTLCVPWKRPDKPFRIAAFNQGLITESTAVGVIPININRVPWNDSWSRTFLEVEDFGSCFFMFVFKRQRLKVLKDDTQIVKQTDAL